MDSFLDGISGSVYSSDDHMKRRWRETTWSSSSHLIHAQWSFRSRDEAIMASIFDRKGETWSISRRFIGDTLQRKISVRYTLQDYCKRTVHSMIWPTLSSLLWWISSRIARLLTQQNSGLVLDHNWKSWAILKSLRASARQEGVSPAVQQLFKLLLSSFLSSSGTIFIPYIYFQGLCIPFIYLQTNAKL